LTSDIVEKTCVVYILLLQKQKRNQKIPCSNTEVKKPIFGILFCKVVQKQ